MGKFPFREDFMFFYKTVGKRLATPKNLLYTNLCMPINKIRKVEQPNAMRFNGFFGNEVAKQAVSAGTSGLRFHHAWLLEGPIGSGRRTLAKHIAQAAVCTGAQGKPCGECAACRKAMQGVHPDIFVISREQDDKAFSADNIRLLREKAYVMPNEADKQVFILCDVQQMQEAAQNALLKILEEPPSTAVFIMTCENRSQVLSTVLSRVTAIPLTGVDTETAVRALQDKFPHCTSEQLREAAELFGGIIGQAEQGLSDGGMQQVIQGVCAVAEALLQPTDFDLVKAVGVFEKDKETMRGVLSALRRLTRDALAVRYGGTTMLSPFPEQAKRWASHFTADRLMAIAEQLESLQYALEGYMNYTLFLTLFCSRLKRATGSKTV